MAWGKLTCVVLDAGKERCGIRPEVAGSGKGNPLLTISVAGPGFRRSPKVQLPAMGKRQQPEAAEQPMAPVRGPALLTIL